MSIEHIFGVIYAALLGGAFGSFANVLILRWHEDSSLLGRSACPHCNRQIKARHLIPVISWFWLRGKCAACRRTIHVQYVAIEAVGVALAVIAALRWNPFDLAIAPWFWFELVVTLSLLVPVVMDIRWKELPVEYLVWLGAAAAIFRLCVAQNPWDVVRSTLLALTIVLIFFGAQIILSRGKWLGMGDIWFGIFMAGVLGWPLIGVALYIAYLLGGIIAVIGLLVKVFHRRSRIPFGPMLAAGTLIALWFGEGMVQWIGSIYG